jgi:hypothetical protein
MLALPAQAIVACPTTAAAATPAVPAGADAGRIARLLAGVPSPGESAPPAFDQYAATASEAWNTYAQTLGQPLAAWAAKELRPEAGRTVFYPFSGPDLPTVLAVYPGASHYVMMSDQYAVDYFNPFDLKEREQAKILGELAASWERFGRLGFFLTQELNKAGSRRHHLSPTMILMAFAVRLGYEVRSVRPTCLDLADRSIRPLEPKDARWGSVRLELHKQGRRIVVDYVQQDLSNRGLGKRPENRQLVESLVKGAVLLKAASHLPQQPGFSTLRDAILAGAPLVVQDETGLDYDALAKDFNVKLYGEYVSPHRLFKEATNPSLVKAYQDRAKEVRPLDFRLGYEKVAGSAIQVAKRK